MQQITYKILLLSFFIFAGSQSLFGQENNVEQELIKLTKKYNEAWKSLNVDSVSRYHAEDIIYYWLGSKGPTSKTEFEKLLNQILPTMKEYRHEILDIQVQVLSDKVAVVSHTYDGEIIGNDGKAGNYDGALTYVFHKRNGEWKIVLIHESARNSN